MIAAQADDAELTSVNTKAAIAACTLAANTWNTNNPTQQIQVPGTLTDILMEIYNAIINAEGFVAGTGVSVNKLADIVDLLAALDSAGGG
jgi:multimeric flavodoxin WrbA